LKVALEMGLSEGPTNKAVPSFRNSFTEYVNGYGRHSENFSLLEKVFTLRVFALCWIVKTIFYCAMHMRKRGLCSRLVSVNVGVLYPDD